MFESRIFTAWFLVALLVWAGLFAAFNSFSFLAEHWYYPAIMVLGAFVAGLTPEGGGAVAFPVLNIFVGIDRELARDFSLMIQSIGMTSASFFILTKRFFPLSTYKPVLILVPIAFVGFVVGMNTLQAIPVYIIQALFLSLITTFAIAYVSSDHRGDRDALRVSGKADYLLLGGVALVGGLFASLFGTGADIVCYTLLVTHFRMKEKAATYISIMVMASISVLGYAYRGLYEGALTEFQIRTWLCAYPVVLFMAPFGAYILSRINVEWMLRTIVLMNIGQLTYFNINNPSFAKITWSLALSAMLFAMFWLALTNMSKPALRRRDRDKRLDR